MAVGCSHGIYADPLALEGVLRFKDQFKPDTVIHLGDFMDATAFRSGAKGTADESSPIAPDLEGGLDFLEKLRPNVVIEGNHERRLSRMRHSPNAVVSHCANLVCNEIADTVKGLKAKYVPYHVLRGWYEIGGVKYMHGYSYGLNAIKNHADKCGNSVFCHTHSPGVAMGQREDNPIAYNVGTLTRIPCMEYAMERFASMGWGQGLVYGEYKKGQSQLCLYAIGRNDKRERWRLPI